MGVYTFKSVELLGYFIVSFKYVWLFTMRMNSWLRSQICLVEDELNITLISAWETGSRAYNFDHEKSDFDITILYRQEDTAYIFEDNNYQQGFSSEQLDVDLDSNVEIEGWDVKRFRELLFQYDPMVYETIHSPQPYIIPIEIQEIAEHAHNRINPIDLFRGHQSAAESMLKQRESEAKELPNKYFFHVVRNILIARYIEKTHTYPSLDWEEFLQNAPDSVFIEISRERARELYETKQSPVESSEFTIPKERAAIESFFEYELQYENHIPEKEIDKAFVTTQLRTLLED